MKLQAWDLRRGEVERANMHKARSKRSGGGAGRGGEGGEGGGGGGGEVSTFTTLRQPLAILHSYLIFVIFFTRAKFLVNKIYIKKRQFFALNL